MREIIYSSPFGQFPLIADSIFEEFFKTLPSESLHKGFPVYDVEVEEDGSIIVEFALAGYKAEQLSVEVEGSNLIVSADKVGDDEKRIGKSRRIARRSFKRVLVNKDNDLNLQALKPSFVDGILRIEIPKKEESKSKKFFITTKQKVLSS